MKENISNVEYASLLYDFYGELLDDNKREVMDLYHEDNLSLSEIAQEQGMTRQGVHYALKKAEASLEKFEAKLGLVATFFKNQRKAEEAEAIVERLLTGDKLNEDDREAAERLKQIIAELAE